MKISFVFSFFFLFSQSFGAEPCYKPVDNVLICNQWTDSEFPLDSIYHGTYNQVIIQGNPEDLTKIPSGGLSGISTVWLEIVGNGGLVTIESGFLHGSEMSVENLVVVGNQVMRYRIFYKMCTYFLFKCDELASCTSKD